MDTEHDRPKFCSVVSSAANARASVIRVDVVNGMCDVTLRVFMCVVEN
jgi:hypothetical protein